MNTNDVTDAAEFIQQHPRLPLDSPKLVGYELLSSDMRPHNPHDMVTLHRMVLDHNGSRGRRIPYLLAEAKDGTLTLWTLPPELLTP